MTHIRTNTVLGAASIALITTAVPAQDASQKAPEPELSPGMVHTLGGEPVPDEVALDSMRRLEKALAEEFAVTRGADVGDNFLGRAFRRLGRDSETEVDELLHQQKMQIEEEIEAAREAFKDTNLPPADPVAQEAHTGSYGVTRTPPYNYDWTWSKDQSGGDAFGRADRANGDIRANSDADDDDGSKAWAAAAVGGFIRPNVPNGYMRLTVSPSFESDGGSWKVLAGSDAKTEIGLVLAEYQVSNNSFEGYLIRKSDTIDNESGGGTFVTRSNGHSLSGTAYVDSAHFYIPWVIVRSSSRNTGEDLFWYSSAFADMTADVPWMRMTIY